MTQERKQERKDNNRKKPVLILLGLLLAIGIIIGSLFAFFSDVVTGDETFTAGTLALVDDASFFLNGSSTPATAEELANLNPGDEVTVEINIENVGTKSAWLQGAITLSGSDGAGTALTTAQFNSVFDVFEGTDTSEATGTRLVGVDNGSTLVFADAVDRVIDGTVETETGDPSIYIEDTETTYVFTLVFSTSAGNFWQRASIGIGYEVSALQYRNNPTPDWSQAEVNLYKEAYGIVTP